MAPSVQGLGVQRWAVLATVGFALAAGLILQGIWTLAPSQAFVDAIGPWSMMGMAFAFGFLAPVRWLAVVIVACWAVGVVIVGSSDDECAADPSCDPIPAPAQLMILSVMLVLPAVIGAIVGQMTGLRWRGLRPRFERRATERTDGR